jgi:hypothetical protein
MSNNSQAIRRQLQFLNLFAVPKEKNLRSLAQDRPKVDQLKEQLKDRRSKLIRALTNRLKTLPQSSEDFKNVEEQLKSLASDDPVKSGLEIDFIVKDNSHRTKIENEPKRGIHCLAFTPAIDSSVLRQVHRFHQQTSYYSD